MAFEALARSMASGGGPAPAAPRARSRRLITAMSIVVHGVAVVAAVAYSYWHIEELSPPTVTVTFVTAAPPTPPPPPAPLGGGAGSPAARRRPPSPPKVNPVPRPSTPEPPKLVAPTVEPPPAPPPPHPVPAESPVAEQPGPAGPGVAGGSKAGVVGGVSGGIPGGTPGGTVGGTGAGPPSAAPVGARFLPPQMGAAQKLSGPEPDFPAVLRATAGMKYGVRAKVCVGTAGSVDGVLILKHGPPMLDASVTSAVKTWRFRPLVANGTPVPFCYFANFDFGSS